MSILKTVGSDWYGRVSGPSVVKFIIKHIPTKNSTSTWPMSVSARVILNLGLTFEPEIVLISSGLQSWNIELEAGAMMKDSVTLHHGKCGIPNKIQENFNMSMLLCYSLTFDFTWLMSLQICKCRS